MYFLLDACSNPHILRFLYFVILIRDLIFTLIPLILAAMLIINFSKAVVSGGGDDKAIKEIPKRVVSAIIIFLVPWIINAIMKVLDAAGLKVAMDYNTCLTNAENSAGNFDYYDDLLEAEELVNQIKEEYDYGGSGSSGSSGGTALDELVSPKYNIRQGDDRWKNHSLKTVGGKKRTIGGAGCGFCSMTMVLRSFGYDVYPDEVVEEIFANGGGNSGTASTYDFKIMAGLKDLEATVLSNNGNWYCQNSGAAVLEKLFNTCNEALREGKKIIVLIPGHYISVLGIRDDNTLYVGDSSDNINEKLTGYWRGFNHLGPYDIFPKAVISKAIVNNKIGSFDLTPYKSISERGQYTIETLFYTTTATGTLHYSPGDSSYHNCWPSITIIGRK